MPSMLDSMMMKADPATMRPIVTTTQIGLGPEQMMIMAPVTRMMRPVPRSGWTKMRPNGMQSIAQRRT